VRTFTMGFHEPGFDEAGAAMAVARHLGTDHTELYVTPDEARAVIPRLPALYDEPFGDCSQIPTFLVAQLARHHVTVVLSGDGGDELFGGYNRYAIGSRLWRGLRPIPAWLRQAMARGMRRVAPAAWGRMFGLAQAVLPRRLHLPQAGDRIHKLADILTVPSAAMMYRHLVSHWNSPAEIVIGGHEVDTIGRAEGGLPDGLQFVEQMMGLDTITYLADDIMVKVDRAAMGVGLESRAPFLDHRVVELAWRVPLTQKIHAGKGKQVLRRILARHVPSALWERPKMGFGAPYGNGLAPCWSRTGFDGRDSCSLGRCGRSGRST